MGHRIVFKPCLVFLLTVPCRSRRASLGPSSPSCPHFHLHHPVIQAQCSQSLQQKSNIWVLPHLLDREREKDRCSDGWMDGGREGWMDGWRDGGREGGRERQPASHDRLTKQHISFNNDVLQVH